MDLFGSILIINTVIVIYTMSGFDIPIRKRLWNYLYKGLPFNEDWMIKPWVCSWCLGTWIGMISLFWFGFSLPNLLLVLLVAYYNDLIKDIMILLKDASTKLIDVIYKLID
jgi:hypothetical protein